MWLHYPLEFSQSNKAMKKYLKIILNKLSHRNSSKLTSFSQTGEDVIIDFLRKVLNLNNFSWIDIGAHNPSYLSNTALFYKKGFKGINIEGDPSLIRTFYKKRKRDINLNVVISDKSEELDFYIIDPPTLNTLSNEEAQTCKDQGYNIKEIVRVKSMLIVDIVNEYCNGVFPDLLTIDTEGFDLIIMKTIDWSNSPKIICVEGTEHSPNILNRFNNLNDSEVVTYLFSKDYFIFAYTYNNVIFVKNEMLKN